MYTHRKQNEQSMQIWKKNIEKKIGNKKMYKRDDKNMHGVASLFEKVKALLVC